jgi:hypothetical protein
MSGPLKYDYRKLKGDPAEAPGLSSYLAGLYLPLAGGIITGELFVASGGAFYLYDPVVDTDQELTVVDGDLFVGGVAVGGGTTDASLLTTGTLADARLSSNVAIRNAANTFASGVIVASSPQVISQTWNNAAVVFDALTVNVTNTASSATSRLINAVVGGSSVFSVRRDGVVNAASYLGLFGSGLTIGTLVSLASGVSGWPVRILTTSSGTRISNGIGNTDLINVDASTLALYTPVSGTGNQNAATPNGTLANLNLASLTASGVARFSGYPTSLLPAAASNEGAITYDTTLDKHVGCNGSSWNALW